MTKQEYFSILLKRDFIQYILLKEPEYTDKEISRKLMSKIDVDLLYDRIKVHIPVILDKYLSPLKIKGENGKDVEVLPDWLKVDIVYDIVDEYKNLIAEEYKTINFMPAILAHIERLTWAQGVDDMAHNLRRFVNDLLKMSTHLAKITPAYPHHYELKEKFEAAKHISIREFLMQDNYKDIADFLEAVTLYCRDLCGIALSLQISQLYWDIAHSNEITGLIDKFDKIHAEAEQESHTLKELPNNEIWDKEYKVVFPMDFYQRNVEDIDAAKAFQMLFLQALARHEKDLKDQHYISANGEIVLFTNPHYDGHRWTDVNFSDLI